MSNFCYLDETDSNFNLEKKILKDNLETDFEFDYEGTKPVNNQCQDKNYEKKFSKNTSKNTCFINSKPEIKNYIYENKQSEKPPQPRAWDNKCFDGNYEKEFDKNTSKNTCYIVKDGKKNKSKKNTLNQNYKIPNNKHHDINCFDDNDSKNVCFVNNNYKDSNLDELNTCDERKKVKFFDSVNRDLNVCPTKKNSYDAGRIDDESFLLLPRINSKQKSKVQLKEKMHPNDYNIDLKSKTLNKTKLYTSYYGDHYGPGKGFGNSVVSNEIRTGLSSREDNHKFNEIIESRIENPRDILFKDYQNPGNLILPFPRGGENTRKSVQSSNKNLSTEFNFKY